MSKTQHKLVAIALCTVGCTTMLLGSLLLTNDRQLVWGQIFFGAVFAIAGYIKLKFVGAASAAEVPRRSRSRDA